MECDKDYIIKCLLRFVAENRGTVTFVNSRKINVHCCNGNGRKSDIQRALVLLLYEGVIHVYRRSSDGRTMYTVDVKRLVARARRQAKFRQAKLSDEISELLERISQKYH